MSAAGEVLATDLREVAAEDLLAEQVLLVALVPSLQLPMHVFVEEYQAEVVSAAVFLAEAVVSTKASAVGSSLEEVLVSVAAAEFEVGPAVASLQDSWFAAAPVRHVALALLEDSVMTGLAL